MRKPTRIERETLLGRLERNLPPGEQKSTFLRLARMDTRYFPHPVFGEPDAIAEIMRKGPPFSLHILTSIWNSALGNPDFENSPDAKKVVLNPEQERTLFIQYNYARFRFDDFLNRAAHRKINVFEISGALEWGLRMKQARDVLVASNLALVFSMGRRFDLFINSDLHELIEQGCEALMRSVDMFDVSKGFKFSTYACRGIIQAMNRSKQKRSERLQKEFPSTLRITPELKVHTADYGNEDIDYIRAMLDNNRASLSDCERQVVDGRFFRGLKLHEVGDELQISKERVRQIQEKAILKLRHAMSA